MKSKDTLPVACSTPTLSLNRVNRLVIWRCFRRKKDRTKFQDMFTNLSLGSSMSTNNSGNARNGRQVFWQVARVTRCIGRLMRLHSAQCTLCDGLLTGKHSCESQTWVRAPGWSCEPLPITHIPLKAFHRALIISWYLQATTNNFLINNFQIIVNKLFGFPDTWFWFIHLMFMFDILSNVERSFSNSLLFFIVF